MRNVSKEIGIAMERRNQVSSRFKHRQTDSRWDMKGKQCSETVNACSHRRKNQYEVENESRAYVIVYGEINIETRTNSGEQFAGVRAQRRKELVCLVRRVVKVPRTLVFNNYGRDRGALRKSTNDKDVIARNLWK